MDGERFDSLTKALAQAATRRRALKGIAVGLLGLTPTLGAMPAVAARCQRLQQRCDRPRDCCRDDACKANGCQQGSRCCRRSAEGCNQHCDCCGNVLCGDDGFCGGPVAQVSARGGAKDKRFL